MQALARQLTALEGCGQSSTESVGDSVSRVFVALRRPLCRLAGVSAVRILLLRALTLATVQAEALRAVTVEADASLIGFDELSQGSDDGVLFIAYLLELLSSFIGEGLTMRILSDVWPGLTPDVERSKEKRS